MKGCVSHLNSEDLISCEPPCWGSGEAALVPYALRPILGSRTLPGLLKRGKQFSLPVGSFAIPNWRAEIGSLSAIDESLSLLDLIVDAVEESYQATPDQFDIPFTDYPIESFYGASSIPFEIRTWDVLKSIGIDTDLDVFIICTGTFYELRSRLGDMRASLDVAVTSSCWLVSQSKYSYGFHMPKQPITLKEAGELARVRSFRNCGLSPSVKTYRSDFANAIGLRWSVGVGDKYTLEEVGNLAGLTRERVRQIALSRPWESPVRQWGSPKILEELAKQLADVPSAEVHVVSTGESIDKKDAIALLVSYGYSKEIFAEPRQLDDDLNSLGIKFSDLIRTAYEGSERLGFLTETELHHHIAEQYPVLVGDLFDEVITKIVVYENLPHGYVYVEQKNSTSYFKTWMTKLIRVVGALPLTEAYKAAERFCAVRIPRLVFPHKSVIEAFFQADPEFIVQDGTVTLRELKPIELIGVEKWLQEQILNTSSSVISRTELYESARADGVRLGTLNVYASYSLYFKPCGQGCLTLTGVSPSESEIEIARIRGRAIRIKTVRGDVEVVGGEVFVSISVGNDLLDNGVFSSTKEIRDLLSGKNYRLVFENNTYGNCGWSGNAIFGFVGVLQAMSVQPGDEVKIAFDLQLGEAVLSFIEQDA